MTRGDSSNRGNFAERLPYMNDVSSNYRKIEASKCCYCTTGSVRREIGGWSGVRERRSRADSQGQPGSDSVIRSHRFTKTPPALRSRAQTTLGGIRGIYSVFLCLDLVILWDYLG